MMAASSAVIDLLAVFMVCFPFGWVMAQRCPIAMWKRNPTIIDFDVLVHHRD
jgi:hypothetical protein